ncbi:Sec-independent protein translocase protein TatB [Methylomonas sp. SURF-2]|uniref:Sec-independent protein translocase protein TatB n=1 Tax=Methylomonas subterranea TaxID=2952225 RepID=A0ABT1TM14_9GAMM|nr:Sec-independent protein translocase protein TatB [Methylomonas sp. SURF-2]MCQ8106263.1 Sec-independent protein translocase protein TatB [Methylomonas sp. SURF-2]
MFDVGFSELLMVGTVALLVIGPEKLPKVARLSGFWLGKAQRAAAGIKEQISQELHAEELRQQLAAYQNPDNLEDRVAALLEVDSALDAIAPDRSLAEETENHQVLARSDSTIG